MCPPESVQVAHSSTIGRVIVLPWYETSTHMPQYLPCAERADRERGEIGRGDVRDGVARCPTGRCPRRRRTPSRSSRSTSCSVAQPRSGFRALSEPVAGELSAVVTRGGAAASTRSRPSRCLRCFPRCRLRRAPAAAAVVAKDAPVTQTSNGVEAASAVTWKRRCVAVAGGPESAVPLSSQHFVLKLDQ